MAARAFPILLTTLTLAAQEPGPVIRTEYHLTARPWKPLSIPRERYLDAIEGVCRFSQRHQDASGAIIDPFLKREHQYATPYYAYAVGTLAAAGRARDLLASGVLAMEHSTTSFAGGRKAIPDEHGEFFIPVLTEALDVYKPLVPAATLARWRERMGKPRAEVIKGGTNNWETYVMKGEWLRYKAGLAEREATVNVIEHAWAERHRARFASAPWFLYHDRSSNPDTLSVEAVGRGNLLALIANGYDGPSHAEIQRLAEAGTRMTLDLQDPSGQVPANGRTDDHVWVDVGYQLAFEVMAERTRVRGDEWLAGQYRHAAELAFQNIQRWRRTDPPFAGSFYITKNHFDPALRVGYQLASEYSNYSGSLMFHLAEAYHVREHEILEKPAPAEIGGYAVATDSEYSSSFANAGGMQIQVNLRGQTGVTHGNLWTPLGLVRFARAGWDTRLGPADGALTETGGVSFGPTFRENGKWVRLADLSARYEGQWSVQFVHPLLVRCAVEYRPQSGQSGPVFRTSLTVTPDGVLATTERTGGPQTEWGVTWPLLVNDGSPLERFAGEGYMGVRYPGSQDRQNFLTPQTLKPENEPTLRGSYGDLLPVRVPAVGTVQQTFIYPQGEGDPSAAEVRAGLKLNPDGWRSPLSRVERTQYVGRTAAGGFGSEIDITGDGKADVTFSKPCGFLIQLRAGRPVAIEADADVDARIEGKPIRLERYRPVPLP